MHIIMTVTQGDEIVEQCIMWNEHSVLCADNTKIVTIVVLGEKLLLYIC